MRSQNCRLLSLLTAMATSATPEDERRCSPSPFSLTPALSQGERGTKERATRDFHGKDVQMFRHCSPCIEVRLPGQSSAAGRGPGVSLIVTALQRRDAPGAAPAARGRWRAAGVGVLRHWALERPGMRDDAGASSRSMHGRIKRAGAVHGRAGDATAAPALPVGGARYTAPIAAAPRAAAMPRKRLPIGIQTFRKIREDDCYYVDKTGFALRLIEEGTRARGASASRCSWTRSPSCSAATRRCFRGSKPTPAGTGAGAFRSFG